MSNERNESGNDARVTDAYRQLANERTPPHLDDKVLRMAAREGRTRYSLLRAWMRPAAWAATIGLSLAIMLELTLFSGLQQDIAEAPTASAGELAPRNVSIVREAEELARVQSGPDQPEAGCTARERETPDTWQECIERLRQLGFADLADAEYAAFGEAHPDYETAAADK